MVVTLSRRFAVTTFHQPCNAWSRECDARQLQINLWPVSASEPLDLEFVFWNDLAFPPHLSSTERAARFDRLVRLVEDCRRGAAGARCILASEHNGDPREILGHPGTLVW